MTMFTSALYRGAVVHRRLRPKAHRLRYSVFNVLLDLDELQDLDRRLRFFSRNRFNLFSFYDRDHGDGKTPLRSHVETILKRTGIDLAGGPIRLLCMPRVLGFVFNPLSIYFCYRPSGHIAAILYEVSNTFGERHYYLIPASENPDSGEAFAQTAAKRFHVSPFLPRELNYRFRIAPPGERIAVSVHAHDAQGLLVAASISAVKSELTDRALAECFAAYPLLTVKVLAGIHWEALKLWLKGVQIWPKPEQLAERITVGKHEGGAGNEKILEDVSSRAA